MLSVVRLSARDAIIRPDKLRDYLLSVGYPDGRGKAEYLHRLGTPRMPPGSSMRTFANRSWSLRLSRVVHRPTARSMRSSAESVRQRSRLSTLPIKRELFRFGWSRRRILGSNPT
jgi:hypothetical protein